MIEPTETESKETLDLFFATMQAIAAEARENLNILRQPRPAASVGAWTKTAAACKPPERMRRLRLEL
jgi:glycine cleavage system protein P-like pyridoxal-binding family